MFIFNWITFVLHITQKTSHLCMMCRICKCHDFHHYQQAMRINSTIQSMTYPIFSMQAKGILYDETWVESYWMEQWLRKVFFGWVNIANISAWDLPKNFQSPLRQNYILKYTLKEQDNESVSLFSPWFFLTSLIIMQNILVIYKQKRNFSIQFFAKGISDCAEWTLSSFKSVENTIFLIPGYSTQRYTQHRTMCIANP